MRMRDHWKDVHPEELLKIKLWLAEIDEKLKIIEKPALEGLEGPRE